MKKQPETPKHPFFARFLEGQELAKAQGAGGPGGEVTLKWPSDGDDYPTS